MNRFAQHFNKPRVLLPVVHCVSHAQTYAAIDCAIAHGADGVYEHDHRALWKVLGLMGVQVTQTYAAIRDHGGRMATFLEMVTARLAATKSAPVALDYDDTARNILGMAAHDACPLQTTKWEHLHEAVREAYRVHGEAVARRAFKLANDRGGVTAAPEAIDTGVTINLCLNGSTLPTEGDMAKFVAAVRKLGRLPNDTPQG